MYTDAEEALASIDRAAALAQERAERYAAHEAALDRLRVTAGSRDGTATVTLAHSGALCDLSLAPSLARATPERVREVVLEANVAAQARLVAEVAALTAETFGAESETTRAITGQYAALFPSAPPSGGGRSGVLR